MVKVLQLPVFVSVVLACLGCSAIDRRPHEIIADGTRKQNSANYDKRDSAGTFEDVRAAMKNPLPPEEASAMLGEVGENWLYGEGVGDTAIKAGSIVLFPPYALWVLGNAAASLSGYEPLYFSDILPEEQGKVWREAYDTVASGPGHVSAALAGEEFRNKDVAKKRLAPYLNRQAAHAAGGN